MINDVSFVWCSDFSGWVYLCASSPFYTFGILMYFYFFPISSVRSSAALMVHMASFIGHVIEMSGQSYHYQPALATDTSHWWPDGDIVLAVSLAVNVTRMKLSRNALDLIVARFKKELASTVKQVEVGKEQVRQQQT